MGGGDAQSAARKPRKRAGTQFHLTTTAAHVRDMDAVIASGKATSYSEVCRQSFYQAKAANSAIFNAPPQRKAS